MDCSLFFLCTGPRPVHPEIGQNRSRTSYIARIDLHDVTIVLSTTPMHAAFLPNVPTKRVHHSAWLQDGDWDNHGNNVN